MSTGNTDSKQAFDHLAAVVAAHVTNPDAVREILSAATEFGLTCMRETLAASMAALNAALGKVGK